MNRRFAAALIVPLVFGFCDRDPVSPELSLPTDFVISNPALVPAALLGLRGSPSISAADERIVYVSLPPHTFAEGTSVQIESPASGLVIRVPLVHGGFDPVPVAAVEGGELKLTVVAPNGETVTRTVKVPARRPPTIVRSDPRKGRTDIALNVSLSVVFSEPVDSRSAAQSIYLLHEGSRVSGTVRFPDNSWTAKFVPDKPLDAQSSYELVVTSTVHDLDGDRLEGSYNALFVTGSVQDSPCPGYADPSDCPPFPTGGSGTISGVVSERTLEGLRPLSNVTVFAWIQLSNGSGYARGGTQVDADGKFTVDLLPSGMIVLDAYAPGYDMPCSTTIQFNGTTATANIELVSESHPLPELATKPPLVKGLVYETTPSGRQPIGGARIFFDVMGGMGQLAATTTTDANGRYAVCQLTPGLGPWPQWIDVVKSGYVTTGQVVSATGTTQLELDIELKR
jgi:hypothetical protein